jgi:hypothetical protein
MGPPADEFFRIAHHDTSGKPRLRPHACAVALSAALLAELIFDKTITIVGGRVELVSLALQPADPLSRAVLQQIWSEPDYADVDVRLESLAVGAYDLVADRMRTAGDLRRDGKGRHMMTRRSTPLIPTDRNQAAWSSMRLAVKLRRGDPFDEVDRFLAGLAVVTDLDFLLLTGAAPQHRDALLAAVAGCDPVLGELLNRTKAALRNAVLSHRT